MTTAWCGWLSLSLPLPRNSGLISEALAPFQLDFLRARHGNLRRRHPGASIPRQHSSHGARRQMLGLNGQADRVASYKTSTADDTAVPRPSLAPDSSSICGAHQQESSQEEAPSQGLPAPQPRKARVPTILALRGDAVCLPSQDWSPAANVELRILRAVEVGQPPGSIKYEIHINLKTGRNGPVVRNSIRLPNPVQTDFQIAVICPEGSDIANAATTAGAIAVGEETLFKAIRSEKIEFDRLFCHEASEAALNKANLGKILGPKGLMPSKRMKTITPDVVRSIRDMAGAADYRERQGVVRMAIGQLGHTPDQLKANIAALMKRIKKECADISEDHFKEVHEVILSTTNGPALSLNGKLRDSEEHITLDALAGVI